MSTLAGRKPKDTYKDLLHIENSNAGLDSTLRTVESGGGDASILALSTSKARVKPLADSTTAFDVQSASGTSALAVDTTNNKVTVNELTAATFNGIVIGKGSTANRPSLTVNDVAMYFDTDIGIWIFWNPSTLSWN